MAAGVPLAAIGVKISYVSGTKDTKPTTGYTRIYDLKTTPDFNPAPNTADATTFDNTEYTTYVDLLKDIGGALEFSANFTSTFVTAWEAVIAAMSSGTPVVNNGGVWFCIDIPDVAKSIFFFGKPSKLGLPSMSANNLIETTVYVTPLTEPVWDNDPTYAT